MSQVQLVGRYWAGETVYELGAAFGISRQTVSEILKRERVATRYRQLSDEQIDEACALDVEGAQLRLVAERFGVRPGTIWHHLNMRGLVRRSSG